MNFVVIVRRIDAQGRLTQDRECSVYGPFISREQATYHMDADIAPVTPAGFSLGVYPMTQLPDGGTKWSIEKVNEFFAIRVVFEDEPYLFKYVQRTEERARQVMLQLIAGFGQPSGVDRDLAANYYHTRKAATFTVISSQDKDKHFLVREESKE